MRIDSDTRLMPTRGWRGKQAQGPKTGRLLDRKLALECLLNLFGAPSLRSAFPFGHCWRIQAEPLKFPRLRHYGQFKEYFRTAGQPRRALGLALHRAVQVELGLDPRTKAVARRLRSPLPYKSREAASDLA
jgi:hypothetical protein